MEPLALFIVVLSCTISFGLGRAFMHFRRKKRDRLQQKAAALALRNRPPEKVALNKAKRRRQLQQASAGKRP